MYKVLIADDEKKICKLIKCLVDWEEKGMEVISVVHSGLEALEIVKAKRPDIVITDIRMPELDGLDLIRELKEAHPDISFVIISGYRQFEYARKALQYGAEDYLLKPIKEKELNQVLDRILLQKDALRKASNEKRQLKETSKEHTKKMRELFVQDLAGGNLHSQQMDREYLIRNYCCEPAFSEFALAGIKLDFDSGNIEQAEVADILEKRVRTVVDNNLGDVQDLLCYHGVCKELLYLFLNFSPKQETVLRHKMRHIISDIKNMGGAEKLSVYVTVGLSTISTDLSDVPDKAGEVRKAMEDRIVFGVDRIIDYKKKAILFDKNDYVNFPVQKRILDCMESRDTTALFQILDQIKERLRADAVNDGSFLYSVWREVIDILLLGCKNGFPPEDIERLKEEFSKNLYACCSQEQMESKITHMVNRLLIKMDAVREEKSKKPVQIAKRYIQLHYMEALTLENVSEYAGLNAAYFSSLFKQEEGVNFSEFLTIVRIKKAKELLMERERTVREIADSVGYQDEKYFSRVFKKSVGLTPSEYRKIYC